MSGLTIGMLATIVSLMPMLGSDPPKRVDIDCESVPAPERTLAKAQALGNVDIYLHGVCKGHFVIDTDGVTLRGANPESGLAAPEGDPGQTPLLEIVNAKAGLRGMIVRGAVLGVFARGWDAEVFLYEVDVHDQDEVGVVADRGAWARLLDSTVRDGFIGIVAQSNGWLNLQNVIVENHEAGVFVFNRSTAAITNTTFRNNRGVGLNVDNRSDANVLGGVFRENGDVHVNANDWSSIRLLYDVTLGSETDTTPYALGAARRSTIASYTTSAIYGDASMLVGSSIELGNTVLDGNLIVSQFSDAFVRDSEITGVVFCVNGGEAICRQTTSGGVIDCPSPTCGSPAPGTAGRTPVVPELPVVERPRLEVLRGAEPRR